MPDSLGMNPLVDLLGCDTLFNVGLHVIQDSDINLGAFFYLFNLRRIFDHGMIRYHMALMLKEGQLLVKIVVAFLIFLAAAAPAGAVSVYDMHERILLLDCRYVIHFHIIAQ